MFAIPSGDGDAKGLQRFVVLFFVELATRPIEIGGISAVANGLWMTQIARNLADSGNGLPAGKRYLIHDGGPAVDGQFPADTDRCRRRITNVASAEPESERVCGALRAQPQGDCLERRILFGERSVRTAVQNSVAHSHGERRNQPPEAACKP